MNTTIRDNIVFSHEYDEAFYNAVLDGEKFFQVYIFQPILTSNW